MPKFVNGALRAVEGLAFPQGTAYLTVPADSYDFDVVPAGGSAADSVLAIPGLPLAADTYYTAVAFDRLASIQPLALVDDYGPMAEGTIRLRAIHTAAGVGQVDIWNLPAEGAPAPLYTDVDFGAVGGYLDVPAQAYTLGFDVDDDARPDLLFDVPALPAGTVANVFAVLDDAGVFLLAQLEDGSTARIDARLPEPEPEPEPMGEGSIRFFHLSPDAPAVDIFANAALQLVGGLAFLAGSERLTVPAGAYDVDIAPAGAGAGASVLSVPGFAIADGSSWTVAAFDAVSRLSVLPLWNDLEHIGDHAVRLRVAHTAVGVGQVDAWVSVRATFWGIPWTWNEHLGADLDRGDASAERDLRLGQYTLKLDLNDDRHADLSVPLPAYHGGQHVNLFVTTDAHGNAYVVSDVK